MSSTVTLSQLVYFSPNTSRAYVFVCSTMYLQMFSVKNKSNTSMPECGTLTVGPTGCVNGDMFTSERLLLHLPRGGCVAVDTDNIWTEVGVVSEGRVELVVWGGVECPVWVGERIGPLVWVWEGRE